MSTASLLIASCGAVDSGKSSLVGVLTSNKADDGRGSARLHVMRHEVERENGRTMDPTFTVMGLDASGSYFPMPQHPHGRSKRHTNATAEMNHALKVAAISQDNHMTPTTTDNANHHESPSLLRAVTFLDCCGHMRFLQTTINRFVATAPHCAMIMVDSSKGGLNPMTIQHIRLCSAMGCPYAIVLTKMDMSPKHIRDATVKALKTFIQKQSAPHDPKRTWTVQNRQDVDTLMAQDGQVLNQYTPVFPVSSVNMIGIDQLRYFFFQYPLARAQISATRTLPAALREDPMADKALMTASAASAAAATALNLQSKTSGPVTVFYIDRTYSARGVRGLIVSGFMLSGTMYPNAEVLLGPISAGRLLPRARMSQQKYMRKQQRASDISAAAAAATAAAVPVADHGNCVSEDTISASVVVTANAVTANHKHTSQTTALAETSSIGHHAAGASPAETVRYTFLPVQVKSLQVNLQSVQSTQTGQCTAAAIVATRNSDKIHVSRKLQLGRVLLSSLDRFHESSHGVCLKFQIDITVTHHATTIQPHCQCVFHSHCVRQTAQLMSVDSVYNSFKNMWQTPREGNSSNQGTESSHAEEPTNILRTGGRALVTMQFIRYPEFLVCNSRMLLREGELRAAGTITKLFFEGVTRE
jgi:GTPase